MVMWLFRKLGKYKQLRQQATNEEEAWYAEKKLVTYVAYALEGWRAEDRKSHPGYQHLREVILLLKNDLDWKIGVDRTDGLIRFGKKNPKGEESWYSNRLGTATTTRKGN
jgi:hypothetical protein